MTVVDLDPVAELPADKRLGAGVGALVGLIAAPIGPPLLLVSMPIGAMLGAAFARHAYASTGIGRGRIVSMAALAVILGSYAVAAAWSVPCAASVGDLIIGTLGLGTLGVVFAGLPAFALTLTSALMWDRTVRWILRRRAARQ
jgi:hypothetical protein